MFTTCVGGGRDDGQQYNGVAVVGRRRNVLVLMLACFVHYCLGSRSRSFVCWWLHSPPVAVVTRHTRSCNSAKGRAYTNAPLRRPNYRRVPGTVAMTRGRHGAGGPSDSGRATQKLDPKTRLLFSSSPKNNRIQSKITPRHKMSRDPPKKENTFNPLSPIETSLFQRQHLFFLVWGNRAP